MLLFLFLLRRVKSKERKSRIDDRRTWAGVDRGAIGRILEDRKKKVKKIKWIIKVNLPSVIRVGNELDKRNRIG